MRAEETYSDGLYLSMNLVLFQLSLGTEVVGNRHELFHVVLYVHNDCPSQMTHIRFLLTILPHPNCSCLHNIIFLLIFLENNHVDMNHYLRSIIHFVINIILMGVLFLSISQYCRNSLKVCLSNYFLFSFK